MNGDTNVPVTVRTMEVSRSEGLNDDNIESFNDRLKALQSKYRCYRSLFETCVSTDTYERVKVLSDALDQTRLFKPRGKKTNEKR